jgi:SAM-dependent methyltransferase
MPTENPAAGDRRRRALEHQGGPAQRRGDLAVAQVLADALESVDRAERDPLTHGVHAYPARMHHAIARTVLEALAEPRTRVLDPFCGSGTVLVEARRLGLRACGVDLNPLALRIAEVKQARTSEAQRQQLAELAEHVVEASLDRVERRERVRAPLSAAEREWYQPHVLLELAGLHAELEALPAGFERRVLEVVFSSIVVKFSRQRAETSERAVQKRIGKKVVTSFFARKLGELLRRWEELAAHSPPDGPTPRLFEGDARRLGEVVGRWRFDLVLGSPPYGGTYDYVEHHARRYPWLGLSLGALRQAELGARRNLSQHGRDALSRWEQEVESLLRSIAGVLSPRARVVLLVGDAEVGGRRLAADRQLESLAGRAGLTVVASASQRRPDWEGGAPRREHLVALEPQRTRFVDAVEEGLADAEAERIHSHDEVVRRMKARRAPSTGAGT